MAQMKTLVTKLSDRERYAVWLHIARNVSTNNGREQDQIDEIWSTLKLDEIQARADGDGGAQLRPVDFSEEAQLEATFTKEELAFLLSVLDKPMAAALSRLTLPIKRRLAEERDHQGLKAVSAE